MQTSESSITSVFHLNTQWVPILAIFAVSFVLRLAFVHEPFERDEGAYAYIAQEILRGSVPYRDVIDIKPPGVYYLYAIGIAVFGDTTERIRIFTAFYSLLSVYAVFLVTRLLAGPKAGLVGALFHGVFSSAPFLQGSSSNTEVFLLFPLLLIVYFLLRAVDGGKRRHIFFCGISCAASMLIKTVSIPFVLLAALGVLSLTRSSNQIRETILDIAALASGPAILGSATLMYFYLNGALNGFLYWNVTFPVRYLSSNVSGPYFISTAFMLLPEFLPLLCAAIPTFVRLLFGKHSRSECIAALTLPASLIGVLLPGKNFPHYFILLVPPLAILGGIGIRRISWSKGRSGQLRGILLGLVFSFTLYSQYKYYVIYTPRQLSTQKYGPIFVESLAVAQYLKKRTLPSDYIFQWGFEMELYYLTSRRSPVSLIASTHVGWQKNPADSLRQMIERINKKKPKYIVFQRAWGDVYGGSEVTQILMRDYFLEATVAYAEIYRRKMF